MVIMACVLVVCVAVMSRLYQGCSTLSSLLPPRVASGILNAKRYDGQDEGGQHGSEDEGVGHVLWFL